MSIETLDDWNFRLGGCGCCVMPTCVLFEIEYERKIADVTASGIYPFERPAGADTDLVPVLYDTTNTDSNWKENGTYQSYAVEDLGISVTIEALIELTYTDYGYPGGSKTGIKITNTHNESTPSCTNTSVASSFTPPYVATTSVACPIAFNTITEATRFTDCSEMHNGSPQALQGCPGPFTVADTEIYNNRERIRIHETTLSDPITPAGLMSDADSVLGSASWINFGFILGIPWATREFIYWPEIGDHSWPPVTNADSIPVRPVSPLLQARLKSYRFRFRISVFHTGSMYKITYDVANYPDDGSPSFVSEDNVVVWTGPGTGEQTDPSWLTPWIYLEPPTDNGTNRVVNIRYSCYGGTRYGHKPETIGPAFTPA